MTALPICPALHADFALVPVAERLRWRDSLARHVIDSLQPKCPEWKAQEQIEPLNATIAILLDRGITDPVTIASHILNMGSVRSDDAIS
jgi:hypothetical protein